MPQGRDAHGNDFNCPEECGFFAEKDVVGPTLHNACEAMKEDVECKEKFVKQKIKDKKGSKKKRKKKKVDHRIVGGVSSKFPMPWMVGSS